MDNFKGVDDRLNGSGRGRRRRDRDVKSTTTADPRTKRFSDAEHARALELLESGLGPTQVAKLIGTTTQSLRRWVAASESEPKMRAMRVSGSMVIVWRSSTSSPSE